AAREGPPGGSVLVLCGPGNNGGDGYVAAQCLHEAGIPVRVVRVGGSPTTVDARDALADCERRIPVVAACGPADLAALEEALRGAAVVVDAVFGLGLSRPVGEPYLSVLRLVEARAARRIAADVPSGMNADTGEPLPVAVRA